MAISNGVINPCADKTAVFAQAYRALKPGGVIQSADIANGVPLPEQATCSIDLRTGCIAGGKPVDDWCALLRAAGFTDISVGPALDAFGGSGGEKNARAFDVFAHVFLAAKPMQDKPASRPGEARTSYQRLDRSRSTTPACAGLDALSQHLRPAGSGSTTIAPGLWGG